MRTKDRLDAIEKIIYSYRDTEHGKPTGPYWQGRDRESLFYPATREYRIDNEVVMLREKLDMLMKHLNLEVHKPDCKEVLRKIPKPK